MRQLGGGGRDVTLAKVMYSVRAAEEQRATKRRTTANRKRKQNSNITDAAPTTASGSRKQPKLAGSRQGHRWFFSKPAGFEASWQRFLAPHARPAVAYPVSWTTMRGIQAADQRRLLKTFYWITPRHLQRTAFDKMDVGLAWDMCKPETSQQLRRLRDPKSV